VVVDIKFVGQWDEFTETARTMNNNSRQAAYFAVRDESLGYLAAVNESFVNSGPTAKYPGTARWNPLSRITIELRKNASKVGGLSGSGTKPLIRTGSLRRSVTWQPISKDSFFVGVNRGAKGKYSNLINVAAAQEGGVKEIRITERMRKYFLFLFIKGVLSRPWPKPYAKSIVIKQRSFLGDTMKAYRRQTTRRVMSRYKKYLTGKM
jgi:hypothetical protein